MGIIKKQPLAPSDAIQILIFLGILATCIFTGINIKQQGEFNRTSLNPWVYIYPIDTLNIPYDTLIEWKYAIKCVGRSPGLEVRISSLINYTAESPYRNITYDEILSPDIKSYIYPNEELFGGGGRRLFDLNLTKENFPEKIKGGKPLYYHIHVLYQDFDKKGYYFGATFVLTDLEMISERRFYSCHWVYCDSYYGKMER